MELRCPHCKADNDIGTEDWPKDCTTTEERECWHCGEEFSFGVTAEIELR